MNINTAKLDLIKNYENNCYYLKQKYKRTFQISNFRFQKTLFQCFIWFVSRNNNRKKMLGIIRQCWKFGYLIINGGLRGMKKENTGTNPKGNSIKFIHPFYIKLQ